METAKGRKREHWGFDDPAKAEGIEEEWTFFQLVRDEISDKLKCFANCNYKKRVYEKTQL